MSDPPQTSGQARLELAITRLSGSMDAAMARIEGRLDLLVQRAEHSDRRADDQDAKIERLDERADQLEATRITRQELDARDERIHAAAVRRQEEASQAAARRLTVIGIVVAVVSIGVSATLSVIAIIVN
ncbi:hypothetical protein SAMN05443665_101742 [Actinomadura meyerae]|uniref:Uncharacterized protein n=1 Tax=Actinomadura meyerae TaxID=240840 RepID=A0A239K7S9_9ACTN|nr:hypothetical protein [Actinomadura meyerae]SNT14155.1 hypothetical protein SAMN05443665_101742 [Actinomadura meyerae]